MLDYFWCLLRSKQEIGFPILLFSSTSMACNGKTIVVVAILAVMVLIPVSLYLVADVAHLFWSNRSHMIKESF